MVVVCDVGKGRVSVYCYSHLFLLQIHESVHLPYISPHFLAFFRRAGRAWSARHARREGCKKNNACTPTIVHAIPPPDTPSNHQPITAFDKSGETGCHVSRATYRATTGEDERSWPERRECQHRRIAQSFYLIYGAIKKQEGNSKLPQHKPQSYRATIKQSLIPCNR